MQFLKTVYHEKTFFRKNQGPKLRILQRSFKKFIVKSGKLWYKYEIVMKYGGKNYVHDMSGPGRRSGS